MKKKNKKLSPSEKWELERKKESEESDRKRKEAKDYIKTNLWKTFFKFKLIELIAIPLIILTLWKIPYWLGWGFIKLFNINPATSQTFCENISTDESKILCDGINYHINSIWLFGFFILVSFVVFLFLNYCLTKWYLKHKASKKFDVSYEPYGYF
jgi:hypothetical protein